MTTADLYLRHAAEAEAEAQRAYPPEQRLRYLDLAEGWRTIAERVQALGANPASSQGCEQRA